MSNIPTVQKIYAAFSNGDIPAILSHLSPTVDWDYGITQADVPWMQRRQGLAGVSEFFQALTGLEFQMFHPKTFLENGPIVVVLIDLSAVVKATGATVTEEDEVHIWHFQADGQVARFTHKADTHQHWLASRTTDSRSASA